MLKFSISSKNNELKVLKKLMDYNKELRKWKFLTCHTMLLVMKHNVTSTKCKFNNTSTISFRDTNWTKAFSTIS